LYEKIGEEEQIEEKEKEKKKEEREEEKGNSRNLLSKSSIGGFNGGG
jgi:hypothetical protein